MSILLFFSTEGKPELLGGQNRAQGFLGESRPKALRGCPSLIGCPFSPAIVTRPAFLTAPEAGGLHCAANCPSDQFSRTGGAQRLAQVSPKFILDSLGDHIELAAKMFSRLRRLFQRKDQAEEERPRKLWERLPCFRRKRKVHPAGGQNTEGLPKAANVTKAVGERRPSSRCSQEASKHSSEDSLMRCSLTASMCSSLYSIDIYDLPGWVIELAMASRRQQVVLDEHLAVRFFKDIKTCTMDSLAANRDQLAVPYSKADLVAAVVELMEEQEPEPTPSDLLPWAMVALYQLSKMQPRTPKDLEARFLRLALRALVILGEPSQDPEGEEAFRNTIKMGEQLLRGLLEEDPSRDHLLSIVEVFGEVFPEERSSFLETARQGLPLPAPPTSNPGLLLFHSLIGMANDLLGAEVSCRMTLGWSVWERVKRKPLRTNSSSKILKMRKPVGEHLGAPSRCGHPNTCREHQPS
ncbi:uncharacterized protein LOC140702035 [Pogona vitticeps]